MLKKNKSGLNRFEHLKKVLEKKVEILQNKCKNELCEECAKLIPHHYENVLELLLEREERTLKNKNFFFNSYTNLREKHGKIEQNERNLEDFIKELQEENKQLQNENFEFNSCQDALQSSIFEKMDEIERLKREINNLRQAQFTNLYELFNQHMIKQFPSFLSKIFEKAKEEYVKSDENNIRKLLGSTKVENISKDESPLSFSEKHFKEEK